MEIPTKIEPKTAWDTENSGTAPCIAIIDDDAGMRSMFAMYLSRQGYTVLTAADGKTGIELLTTHKLDAVLLDLHMPQVTGFDVLEEAKPVLSDVPVVVVSGTSDIGEAMKAIKMGAIDFLLKPITDLSIITHTLEKSIERFSLKRQSKAYQLKLEETVQTLREGEIAAKKMQKRLLPPPSCELCGFSLTGNLLARDYLSGDFYDYFALNDTTLIFYLADIAGHGVSSAFVTVLLKSIVNKCVDNFHKNADDTIIHPHKFLQQLNKEICAEHLGKYLTIFFGKIDLISDTLSYVNGGHFPPPIIVKEDTEEYAATGESPVGIDPEATFQTKKIELTDQFQLYLFSDGVIDAMLQGSIREKMEKLRDLVQLGRLEPFYEKLKQQDQRTDDMSLVTLKRI